jgi:hypothetical protein
MKESVVKIRGTMFDGIVAWSIFCCITCVVKKLAFA